MRLSGGIHERHLLWLSSHCNLGLHVPRHGAGRASHHTENVPAPVAEHCAGISAGGPPVAGSGSVAREGWEFAGCRRQSACARRVRGNAGRGASNLPGSARTSSFAERGIEVAAFALCFFSSLHVKMVV
ncbi:hypothetical protein ZIOFF_034003 [Zingiber officinale]|uniref:Uncharacterized protein n=1 Tax=Zingiber officinale TaxID=94328 RepID=A0A8J5GRB1_ZINOF|nr:hypothetical protein ZIOFF_034003 [Zingiber officinale]